MRMDQVPPEGLQGTHEEACIVCLNGTDTGLAFTGEAEWVIAGLARLGVPVDQASVIVSDATGDRPGIVPAASFTLAFQVCDNCAQRRGLKVGLVALGVPNYGARS